MVDKIKKTSGLIPVKKSHIEFYNKFPLYYISKDGEAVLFKKDGDKIKEGILEKEMPSRFFIREEDENSVTNTLLSVLNIKMAKAISSKGIKTIKQCLCQIVEEALENPLEGSLSALPETIEILFYNAKKTPELLDALTSINSNSPKIIEHSVNVLTLTAQYCFFKKYSDDELRKFGLCALLHDVGTSYIDKKIIEKNEQLTEEEFKELKTHTTRGYKKIKSHSVFDKSVAMTALEHHELLDGSGYPSGTKNISFEAQVIGLIDSYEPLKYSNKSFREALTPYNALQIIKKDVLQGKYNKQVFIDLCSCWIK